eukprot:Ihof_evm4s422 gene=Ihof_evmTU4s422
MEMPTTNVVMSTNDDSTTMDNTSEERSTTHPSEPSTTQLSLRSLIATKDVGAIIGKGGATVNQFREATGTKIVVSEAQQHIQERVMTITGTVDMVGEAYSLVAKKLKQDAIDRNEPLPKITTNILTHYSQTGAIIGKGGAKVKEIRETTGAQISISQDVLPQSTERTVTISGTPEAIGAAIVMVGNCLVENPVRGQMLLYRPDIRMDNMNDGYGQRGRMNMSMPPGRNYAPFGNQYNQRFNQAYQGRISPLHISNEPETTQIVTIPSEMVGAIIGKRGMKINEIRQVSGVLVKIADAVPNSTERDVILT